MHKKLKGREQRGEGELLTWRIGAALSWMDRMRVMLFLANCSRSLASGTPQTKSMRAGDRKYRCKSKMAWNAQTHTHLWNCPSIGQTAPVRTHTHTSSSVIQVQTCWLKGHPENKWQQETTASKSLKWCDCKKKKHSDKTIINHAKYLVRKPKLRIYSFESNKWQDNFFLYKD